VEDVAALQAGGDSDGGGFSAAVSGRMVRHGEPAEWVPRTTIATGIPHFLYGIQEVGAPPLVSELAFGGS
jgi:hypothetical protein